MTMVMMTMVMMHPVLVKYDHHHYDGDDDEKGDLDHSVMSLFSFQSSGTGSLWRGVSGPLQKVTKWGGKD